MAVEGSECDDCVGTYSMQHVNILSHACDPGTFEAALKCILTNDC